MGIFGALIADKLVPQDENGSRGAADILLGAGGASMGAAVAAAGSAGVMNNMKDMVSGVQNVDSPAAPATTPAVERISTPDLPPR